MREVPKSFRYVNCPSCGAFLVIEDLFGVLGNKAHCTADTQCSCGTPVTVTVYADRTAEVHSSVMMQLPVVAEVQATVVEES